MVRVKDRIIMRKHSKSGKVERFFYKGKELSQMTFRDGYKMVRIGVDGERFTLHVGRLVAQFIALVIGTTRLRIIDSTRILSE